MLMNQSKWLANQLRINRDEWFLFYVYLYGNKKKNLQQKYKCNKKWQLHRGQHRLRIITIVITIVLSNVKKTHQNRSLIFGTHTIVDTDRNRNSKSKNNKKKCYYFSSLLHYNCHCRRSSSTNDDDDHYTGIELNWMNEWMSLLLA